MSHCIRCNREIKHRHYAYDGRGPFGSVCVQIANYHYDGTLFPDGYKGQGMPLYTVKSEQEASLQEAEPMFPEIVIDSYDMIYDELRKQAPIKYLLQGKTVAGKKTIKVPKIEDIIKSKHEEYRDQREDFFRRASELIKGIKNVKYQN